MEKTQTGLRKRICIIGAVNVGKSSLFNALTENQVSIVSDIAGTTTDSVSKAYEIIGYGPVVFCDTAGFGDNTALGKEREKATLRTLKISDCAVIVRESAEVSVVDVQIMAHVKACGIPFIIVYNQKNANALSADELCVNAQTGAGVEKLLDAIRQVLQTPQKETLLEGLITEKQSVLLVMPQDSAAPTGRLILPQVQMIRECLDRHIVVTCVAVEEIETALQNKTFDLVITDSKVIKEVLQKVSPTQKVSTFSVLFAKAKGHFDVFLQGVDVIDLLQEGDSILIAEACSHTTTEDDIAKVMMPKILQKYTGKKLHFEFASGRELPANLSKYKLICQCGGCMLTRLEMIRRIEEAQKQGVSITNYGLAITKCQTGHIRRLTF